MGQVETIGDAYMIVGGVPKKADTHALNIAEMSFSMLNAMKTLKDPSDRSGKGHLKLRVGMHNYTHADRHTCANTHTHAHTHKQKNNSHWWI